MKSIYIIAITAALSSTKIAAQQADSSKTEIVVNTKMIERFYQQYNNIEAPDFKELYRSRNFEALRDYLATNTSNALPRFEEQEQFLAKREQEETNTEENID